MAPWLSQQFTKSRYERMQGKKRKIITQEKGKEASAKRRSAEKETTALSERCLFCSFHGTVRENLINVSTMNTDTNLRTMAM